jgi:ribosomal protein L7/L12
VLERVIHIAPEVMAYRLHQSEAVKLKVDLEAAGAKVRIR